MDSTEAPLHAVAEVPTTRASGYLQRLCKHFAHKLPVTFDARTGRIEFAAGVCLLKAEGQILSLRVEAADDEDLGRLEDVVARHLVRFAFRDELQVAWRR